ncbi:MULTISPECIES: porin family protein [unclassified Lentimicrobium]|uniref:porin family protein n=1 Tax=unclassified Lentimicrobium TaxID=2677434 RepID=UPI0015537714|nr:MULTISPECIES: porin family protein [unclassified Lentimicrobium]NPD46273.1 PorT family protein [Lentimicrobium sp. S6]NPD83959.1 PorT family protein [Lentimicrobium sp. L6]
MRKLFLVFTVLLMSTALMAQLPNIGIRGGLTTSKLSTNLSENFASENQLGYQGGVFVRLKFNKLYIQPEAIYNHRSTKLEYEVVPVLDYDNQKVGAKTSMKIGTIDVPVLVGFYLVKSKMFNLRIFAGPEISFASSKSVEYQYTTGDGTDFNGEVVDPITVDDFNQTTWYMQAGAGVDVLFFTFDVRYEKGLSDLYNKSDFNFKNNVWVFTLGFKFI